MLEHLLFKDTSTYQIPVKVFSSQEESVVQDNQQFIYPSTSYQAELLFSEFSTKINF